MIPNTDDCAQAGPSDSKVRVSGAGTTVFLFRLTGIIGLESTGWRQREQPSPQFGGERVCPLFLKNMNGFHTQGLYYLDYDQARRKLPIGSGITRN